MADDVISIEKQQLKPALKVSSHSTDGEGDIAPREDVLGDNLSMMGDLSYMIYGDEEETTEPDRQNIATIHWSGSLYSGTNLVRLAEELTIIRL